MAGWDTLLSLAGSSGGQSSNKIVPTTVPINVNPIGINLGEIFQPSNLGTTGTMPALSAAPTQAAAAQASLLGGSNSTLLIIGVAVVALLLLKRKGG